MEFFVNSLTSYFDKVSKNYTKNAEQYPMKLFKSQELSIIEEFIDTYLKDEIQVLEVGAGSGIITKSLVRGARDVVAIDVSSCMCQELRKREFDVEIINEDFMTYKSERHFDAIVMIGVLEFCEDVLHTFQKVRQVLKPGGFLIVTSTRKSLISTIYSSLHRARGLIVTPRSRAEIVHALTVNSFKIRDVKASRLLTDIMVAQYE